MIIKLPFPAHELFPNRKNGKHWSATLRAKQKQRSEAFVITAAAFRKDFEITQKKKEWPVGDIPLSLVYLTPDKRKRDADNMLAASKAMIDGMAQALGIDDSRFRPILVDWVQGPQEGGLLAALGVEIISGVSYELTTKK